MNWSRVIQWRQSCRTQRSAFCARYMYTNIQGCGCSWSMSCMNPIWGVLLGGLGEGMGGRGGGEGEMGEEEDGEGEVQEGGDKWKKGRGQWGIGGWRKERWEGKKQMKQRHHTTGKKNDTLTFDKYNLNKVSILTISDQKEQSHQKSSSCSCFKGRHPCTMIYRNIWPAGTIQERTQARTD